MKQYTFTVGCISWIDPSKLPHISTIDLIPGLYEPGWVPKVLVGLSATANHPPPRHKFDFDKYSSTKGYRAMTHCRITVVVDEKTQKIVRRKIDGAVLDGGYTPPFSKKTEFEGTVDVFDTLDYTEVHYTKQHIPYLTRPYYPGQKSSLSAIKSTVHANSTIPDLRNDIVAFDDVIKFRAGPHTDDVGINKYKGSSPFHVPWVWSETALTYAKGHFTLQGRGSIFPSHAWYVNGEQVLCQMQVGDTSIPYEVAPCMGSTKSAVQLGIDMIGPPYEEIVGLSYMELKCLLRKRKIVLGRMKLYPAISSGPTIKQGAESATQTGIKGPVDQHLYTLPGGTILSTSWPA